MEGVDIEEMEMTRGRENTNTNGCHKFWTTLKSFHLSLGKDEE